MSQQSVGIFIEVMSILLPLAGGGFAGYFLKYYLDKKQQFISQNAEYKRGAYSELIALLMDVTSPDNLENPIPPKELIARLNKAYSLCILYASPDVINAFGDTLQHLYDNPDDSNPRTTLINMTRIFKYMREDINLSNKSLGDDAIRLMRVRLNDYRDHFGRE